MRTPNPELYATLINTSSGEVRHLLVFFLDGSRQTQLVQVMGGIDAPLDFGSENEVKQTAELLRFDWEQEGFTSPVKGYAFESLERTVALAQMMCFTHIFTDGTPENSFGFEPLSSWPGMTAQNGGRYLYALDNMRIHAAPLLQPGLETIVNLNAVKSPHPNVARMLARVGAFRSFTLAGVEAITGLPFTEHRYAV
jgi:hypothetical protein